ncbi:hypothetical protein GGR53DRAFT_428273 [Hypoxylon sp. FL1150]|nr:hypothetical protein GGR53DRAFT_428273 [Hypoxylon sp. FL1150]
MDSVAPEASWRESSPPGNEAQEKYQCSRCPSSFKRPEHLKRHQRSHDGHKPFMCSICMKRFFRSDILTRHELMHLAAQRTNTLNRKRACTECARARERCSRDEPCMRCSTKSLQCLYPDDAGRGTHSLSHETLTSSSGNDHGQIEEHSPTASQNYSLLPKSEASMSSSSLNGEPFNEGDASLREFLYALRSQTSSSYPPTPSHSPNLLGPSSSSGAGSSLQYRISRERQPSSSSTSTSIALGPSAAAGNSKSSGGFLEPGLETGRQAPMFEQPPGASFTRPHDHDMIDLDDPRFGQAPLGEYSNLCPTAVGADPPSFDLHAEAQAQAMASAVTASSSQPRQLVSSASDSDALLSTADPTAAAISARLSRRSLSLSLSSNYGSQPINLKAYELIASNFKELCLEYGNGAAPVGGGGGSSSSSSSNNISESQRTAQHEFLVKLYYEHFKQQAY